MGRSVSYPSAATVVTFKDNHGEQCSECSGSGSIVAAFGELSKVGSMSNGEGVYRRIDK